MLGRTLPSAERDCVILCDGIAISAIVQKFMASVSTVLSYTMPQAQWFYHFLELSPLGIIKKEEAF